MAKCAGNENIHHAKECPRARCVFTHGRIGSESQTDDGNEKRHELQRELSTIDWHEGIKFVSSVSELRKRTSFCCHSCENLGEGVYISPRQRAEDLGGLGKSSPNEARGTSELISQTAESIRYVRKKTVV